MLGGGRVGGGVVGKPITPGQVKCGKGKLSRGLIIKISNTTIPVFLSTSPCNADQMGMVVGVKACFLGRKSMGLGSANGPKNLTIQIARPCVGQPS